MDDIFDRIRQDFKSGVFHADTSFYFSVGDTHKTLVCGKDGCAVHDGKAGDHPDCTCKMTEEIFCKIIKDKYMPGVMDMMSGKIKTDNPLLLLQLVKAFGR